MPLSSDSLTSSKQDEPINFIEKAHRILQDRKTRLAFFYQSLTPEQLGNRQLEHTEPCTGVLSYWHGELDYSKLDKGAGWVVMSCFVCAEKKAPWD